MSVIGDAPLVGRRVDAEFGFDAVQSGFEVVVALADIFVLARATVRFPRSRRDESVLGICHDITCNNPLFT